MKSWTRTLNHDDAHTILAVADPGQPVVAWARAVDATLPHLSRTRRGELVRLLRRHFLTEERGRLVQGPFLSAYQGAPASAQLQLVSHQWALSHPLGLLVNAQLVAPALQRGELELPLAILDALVAEQLDTSSPESRRKTRTVLLSALEGVGTVSIRGTGQHHRIEVRRGRPQALVFAYLLCRQLAQDGLERLSAEEAATSSLPARLTLCGPDHAREVLEEAVRQGALVRDQDWLSPA